MTFVTKISLARVKLHLSDPPPACWQRIVGQATARSVWVRPFEGGFGEVVLVTELYCRDCHVEPRRPAHGTPICEDELIDIDAPARAGGARMALPRP